MLHPTIRLELGRADAADRVARASRAALPERHRHPPPLRKGSAYAVARLARRLDAESARRAVA